jgi:toxin secretion/phage lysis holin
MKAKLIFAILGGIIADLMGGWDAMLKTLVLFVVVDYATGILAAIYKRKLSSAAGYRGIIKKTGIFAIVLIAAMIDKCFHSELVRNVTIVFYIANEGISILENVGKTGVKYPKKLRDILEQLRDKEVKKGGGKK